MSIPAAGGARRAPLIAAALLTAGFLALWLLLPDKTFVFDGVMFSGVIERTIAEWRRELFNPRHLLFNPALQLLRDALGGLGVPVAAYRLVQIVNALAGAAGLWLFGGLLRRLVDDDAVAVCGAALLGATWTYGTRATEGQVYMLLGLGGLWTLWTAARLIEAPSRALSLHLAVAFALTTLFHAAGAFLAPAVVAALWLAFPSGRARMLPALALAAALILIPYRVHFSAQGLQGFLGQATDYRLADSRGYWTGLFVKFWTNGGLTPGGRVLLSWMETGRALLVMPEKPGTALGAALWAAVAVAVTGAWKALDNARRKQVLVLALAWAGFLFLNAFWVGGLFFAVLPAACLLALLAAAAGPRLKGLRPEPRRRLVGALGAAALALGGWNARAGLWPQSLIENNAAYDQALYLKAHTVPSSFIVIAGVVNSNLKVYIPNVAGRARDVLEYYFMSRPKAEALGMISRFVARQAQFGIPLYLLGEVVDDPKTAEEMRRLWGVAPEEIQAAFGSGRLIGVARRSDVAVYLFVPRDRRPELFVGLGYSVLTEDDPGRLRESVSVLKELARDMTPAEKRRAGELLGGSEWGFLMLREGFSAHMNAAMRDAAAARGARFREFQKTADFWLRAGNLYKFLDLKPETIAAWSRAQKISGDKGLLKDLEALKNSKPRRG